MKNILLASLLVSAALPVFSDTLIGGDIEVNAWQQNQTFRGNGHDEDNDEIAYTFEASIEHFIPLVPNVKYGYSGVDGDDYKYTKHDFTLYYEIFDNDILSFDAGVGVSQFSDGSVRVDSIGWQDFDGPLPHLYLGAEVGIPSTPIFLFAKGSGVTYKDNDMLDYSVGIQYEFSLVAFDIELQGGYRSQTIDLVGYDDLTIDLDAETSGFFAGVNFDF
ncbi:TIGR04219 family outer membrane beta-barrel protein [Psychromonas sp.]|nr:TIGR04219 family outer membrane beta-barrel protein [Psychromonas sp.]